MDGLPDRSILPSNLLPSNPPRLDRFAGPRYVSCGVLLRYELVSNHFSGRSRARCLSLRDIRNQMPLIDLLLFRWLRSASTTHVPLRSSGIQPPLSVRTVIVDSATCACELASATPILVWLVHMAHLLAARRCTRSDILLRRSCYCFEVTYRLESSHL